MKRKFVLAAAAATLSMVFAAGAAKADLKMCNKTQVGLQIAIGYKDNTGWASEGWWTVKPGACGTLLHGDLIARYYYILAIDVDHKSNFIRGKAMFCSWDKIFTIRGIDKCEERGYQQNGFAEFDTGEKADYTIELSDSAAGAPPAAAPAPAPAPTAAAPNAPAPIPAPAAAPAPAVAPAPAKTQ